MAAVAAKARAENNCRSLLIHCPFLHDCQTLLWATRLHPEKPVLKLAVVQSSSPNSPSKKSPGGVNI